MNWTTFDTWIVITGALCAMGCALPGCFLVLRKMSMMGDAISHAVLPGLAAAFLVTGSRASLTMFLGAAIVGVLTAVFTQWISRFGNVDRGAAMGIVFTTLFALGLILIKSAGHKVDLDPDCVLYGAIELTPLDTLSLFGYEIPRAAVVSGSTFLLNLLIIIILFKEFRLSAFDSGLADTLGFSSHFLHYLLMIMVAVTTVASFEAVGSVIVIAMLIVPAATALLLTHRLSLVLILSCLFAVAAAFLGHLGAITIPTWFGFSDTNTSGMMATATGFLFLLVWVFAPKTGLMAKLRNHSQELELPESL
jgi:manganese/zinc/iron transport system permease protein